MCHSRESGNPEIALETFLCLHPCSKHNGTLYTGVPPTSLSEYTSIEMIWWTVLPGNTMSIDWFGMKFMNLGNLLSRGKNK